MIDTYRAILLNDTVPFGYRISWLANFFREPIFKHVGSEYGLTQAEFLVIFCLAHMPGVNSVDICRVTGRPRNSISRAVIELQRKRYIARDTDADDRRRGLLRLTALGQRIYEAIIPLFQARQDAMISVLSPDERATLDTLLTKLVDRNDDWAKVY